MIYFPQLAGYLYSQVFLSTVQTSILPYKDHFITVARQLASLVKNKAHIVPFLLLIVSFGYINQQQIEITYG